MRQAVCSGWRLIVLALLGRFSPAARRFPFCGEHSCGLGEEVEAFAQFVECSQVAVEVEPGRRLEERPGTVGILPGWLGGLYSGALPLVL